MNELEYKKTVFKVGIITIVGNLLLTIGKIIAGILAKSNSLISDGVHSGSDVLSTIIVMIGAKLSSKKADKDHPFGHERIESIASIILGMLLIGTAILLGYTGITSIIEFSKGNIPTRSEFIYVALGFAIASIVVKFLMYLYTIVNAKKINSTALKADAYHHLSDSLSSIGSVLGIVGILIGGKWAILDPIASLIIALFIIKVAIDILIAAFNEVVDKSADDEFNQKVYEIAKQVEGVQEINSLKTRQFGNRYYVELEIAVDPKITVEEGHAIGSMVHHNIEKELKEIKHCMVHVDPHIK